MLDIDIYRLRLFTIFNDAVLHSFDPKGFQYQTEEERTDEFLDHVEQAKKQGYSF